MHNTALLLWQAVRLIHTPGHCRFQIVALPDGIDSDVNNGSWRVGDWADTLELPNIGTRAIVRWVPGPFNLTGTLCLEPP